VDIEKIRAHEMQTFLAVRNRLNTPETRIAFIRSYKKPWRFYRENTVEEAVRILIKEQCK
jgi:hypothetical protein